MKRIYTLFLLLVTHYLTVWTAHATEVDNVIGKKFELDSKVLNEKRTVQIYFPQGYADSKEGFPVLYMLDGQRLHTLGVSLSQSMRATVKMAPAFIVVSINNKYPDRFSHFTQPEFSDFIQKELIPHVDKHYKSTQERILFGWEFAGSYAIETMLQKPGLFSGHIAASPYPLAETWFADKTRLEQLEASLKPGLKSHLYFTVSQGEGEGPGSVVKGTEAFNELLKEKAPETLHWKYRVIPEEEHLTTAHATLYQGLMHYFYGYKMFQIDSLDNFLKAGGLKHFYAYNKLRAKRFGFSEKPEPWSMFTIVRNAMRADNFAYFDKFVKAFEHTNLFEGISIGRAHSIAQFYVSNGKGEKATSIYKKLVKAHPENARLHHEMGKISRAAGDKIQTKLHFKKAVELAEKSQDKRLSQYRDDLASL